MRKSVRILGHNYSVEIRDAMSSFGKGSLSEGRIILDEEQCEGQLLSTLIHEVIELINSQLELKMAHNMICGVETGLYQFLVENGVDIKVLLDEAE